MWFPIPRNINSNELLKIALIEVKGFKKICKLSIKLSQIFQMALVYKKWTASIYNMTQMPFNPIYIQLWSIASVEIEIINSIIWLST